MNFMEVKEIGEYTAMDSEGRDQDMTILQTANNHVFFVLSSYLEQTVGPLLSPYDNVELVFKVESQVPNGPTTFETNVGYIVDPKNVEFVF